MMDLRSEFPIGDNYLCEYWTGCPLGSRVRYKLPDGTAQRLCYPHSDMRKKEVAEDRRYMGICDCFQPLAEGKRSCQDCLDEARTADAERRAQRSEPGICSACGTSVPEDQEWCSQCFEHSKTVNTYTRLTPQTAKAVRELSPELGATQSELIRDMIDALIRPSDHHIEGGLAW